MTKKHYEAIAAAIKRELELNMIFANGERHRATLKGLAESLASYFAADNPKFSRAKFLVACGL